MGCLGTLLVVAIIGAYVVVLLNFPKQTLGCTVGLVLLIILGVAALFQNERQKNEDAARERASVTADISYTPKKCGEANPLAITVRNGSNRTLNEIDFTLAAFRPGYSTNLLQYSYGETSIKWDRILGPGQSDTLCYSVPKSLTTTQSDPPQSLEFKLSSNYPMFQ